MTLADLEGELATMLKALFLVPKKIEVIKGVSCGFAIEEFGVLVCGIHRLDYSQTQDVLNRSHRGWRVIYITTDDHVWEKREDIIWALMRSGYIRQIRNSFPRSFHDLVTLQNFGRRIIEKRLEIWAEKPKYKWWIEENKSALKTSVTYILSKDPAFFDYMPEEA